MNGLKYFRYFEKWSFLLQISDEGKPIEHLCIYLQHFRFAFNDGTVTSFYLHGSMLVYQNILT